MVIPVGHVNRPITSHGDAPRRIKLPIPCAAAAPLKAIRPAAVELLNPVIPRVGHINRAIRGHGDTGRVAKLPVPRPERPPNGAIHPGRILVDGHDHEQPVIPGRRLMVE